MKTKQIWLGIFSSAVMATFLTSCGTPKMGVVKGMPPEEAAMVEQIMVPNSRGITNKLAVGGIRSWKDESERLNVQVQFANKGYRDVRFEYYFEWMDDAGVMLPKATTGWTPEVVYGYGRKEVVGVAPSPQATRFRVQIKESD